MTDDPWRALVADTLRLRRDSAARAILTRARTSAGERAASRLLGPRLETLHPAARRGALRGVAIIAGNRPVADADERLGSSLARMRGGLQVPHRLSALVSQDLDGAARLLNSLVAQVPRAGYRDLVCKLAYWDADGIVSARTRRLELLDDYFIALGRKDRT